MIDMVNQNQAKLNQATDILSELLKSNLNPQEDLKIVAAQELLLQVQL
jgi:hypothetical protein